MLADQSYELVFKLNGWFNVGDWFYATPDLQYVVNPNGGGIPNAVAAGIEVSVDF